MILTIDTSHRRSSVALVRDGVLVGERQVGSSAEFLVAELEALLQTAKISLPQLQMIAVIEGPGSFTGLRVGFSVAKTLARLYEKPVYGVSSLLALAESLSHGPDLDSYALAPIIHSSRHEFYFALLSAKHRDRKLTVKPQLMAADRLWSTLPPRAVLFGMGLEALLENKGDLSDTSTEWLIDAGLHTPSALAIARLAVAAQQQGAPTLNLLSQPNYLRDSEAERRRGFAVKNL